MKNNEWKIEDNLLTKTYKFNNFILAVLFVDKIVPIAEKLNHHPDIEIFSYNKVKIKLTTHDEGGVTEIDYSLAKKIDEVL